MHGVNVCIHETSSLHFLRTHLGLAVGCSRCSTTYFIFKILYRILDYQSVRNDWKKEVRSMENNKRLCEYRMGIFFWQKCPLKRVSGL